MRALPLASHPSSWELSAALGLRLRETTGATGLEPGMLGAFLVYMWNNSPFISWGGHLSPKVQCSAWATRWQPGAASTGIRRAYC